MAPERPAHPDVRKPAAPYLPDPPDACEGVVAREQEREDLKSRLEREHHELLEELRALIPGAEVLFGFLLAIRFTEAFERLGATLTYVYAGTLLCTALALVLFLAPAAHHRLRFRGGDKAFTLRKGNREAIAGSLFIALAFTGVLYLVFQAVVAEVAAVATAAAFFLFVTWRWWALALLRRFRSGVARDPRSDQ